jgi:Rod binding domain-containing protein
MMLKELRATVNKSGLMDGGKAEELYTSLMDTQMSREMAAQGGIGLAEMLYRQMMEASGTKYPEPDTQSPPDATNKEKTQMPKR